jgi:ectoine hydroxylase-related dioxygenase (phytanoyl-CoA dioxygenase family)
VVKVAAGTLLVFPAWLPHSVESNRSTRSRISVSFNVMFSDLADQLAQPLWGEA